MKEVTQWDKDEAAKFIAIAPECTNAEALIAGLCAVARDRGYADGVADTLLQIHDPDDHANKLDEAGAADWENT